MENETRVYFLSGTIPVQGLEQMCAAMEWANDNGFKIEHIVSSMMLVNKRVVGANQQGPAMETINFVYCSARPEDFKNYFGFDYDEDRLKDLPNIIGEIETAKIKVPSQAAEETEQG